MPCGCSRFVRIIYIVYYFICLVCIVSFSHRFVAFIIACVNCVKQKRFWPRALHFTGAAWRARAKEKTYVSINGVMFDINYRTTIIIRYLFIIIYLRSSPRICRLFTFFFCTHIICFDVFLVSHRTLCGERNKMRVHAIQRKRKKYRGRGIELQMKRKTSRRQLKIVIVCLCVCVT